MLVAMAKTMDTDRAKRYRTLWEDEIAGATLYRALAESADERRKPILLALAEAEEKHAEHWAHYTRYFEPPSGSDTKLAQARP